MTIDQAHARVRENASKSWHRPSRAREDAVCARRWWVGEASRGRGTHAWSRCARASCRRGKSASASPWFVRGGRGSGEVRTRAGRAGHPRRTRGRRVSDSYSWMEVFSRGGGARFRRRALRAARRAPSRRGGEDGVMHEIVHAREGLLVARPGFARRARRGRLARRVGVTFLHDVSTRRVVSWVARGGGGFGGERGAWRGRPRARGAEARVLPHPASAAFGSSRRSRARARGSAAPDGRGPSRHERDI